MQQETAGRAAFESADHAARADRLALAFVHTDHGDRALAWQLAEQIRHIEHGLKPGVKRDPHIVALDRRRVERHNARLECFPEVLDRRESERRGHNQVSTIDGESAGERGSG